MKKFFNIGVLFGLIPLFFGCKSLPIQLSNGSPMAIVTIRSNSYIPWESEDPSEEDDSDSIITGLVTKVLDSNNPELLTAIDRLDYIDEEIRHVIPEINNCQIVDKDKVVKSKIYKRLKKSYYNTLVDSKLATGYKDLTTLGSKNARLLMKEVGAKSILIIDGTFKKKIVNGTRKNGELAGIAFIKFKILNEKGSEVINKVITTITEKSLIIEDGIYDKDEFVLEMNTAINLAIRQFAVMYL